MAVRSPLKLDGSNNLIEMNATDITNIQNEMIRQYGLSPTATIAVPGTAGTFGTINDTRWRSGAASTSVSAYVAEATTAEPTQLTVAYATMNTPAYASLSVPPDTSNRAFPVYLTAGGHIQSMSLTDMYDTFISPVITSLTTQATTTSQAGTYRIHTANTLAGHTLVSATPIFTDTYPNVAGYLAANIGTAGTVQDVFTTGTSYYLFTIDPATVGTIPTPLFATANGDLQQYTTAALQTLLADAVRYYSTQVGSKITYTLGTSTTGSRGSGMVNTDLSATPAGTWTTLFVNSNDYRSQEFPNGTVATILTTYLGCVRG